VRSWYATFPEHSSVGNIRNDSRVGPSIETAKRNAMTLNEYLVILA